MKLAVLLAALLGALAIPVGLLLARGGNQPDFRGSVPPDGIELPVFALRDDQGRTVRSADLRGKTLAVTFLDSQCTDACPVIAAQISQAVGTLGGNGGKVEALAITVDPIGDTRNRIEAFLRRYHAKGTLHYLDGTVAELRPVWKDFGVLPSLDTGSSNIHSAPVRVYDAEGRWRSTLHPGADLTATNLAHDLREAQTAS